MSTAFWIPSLINDTVLHFSNIILIKKINFLSENSFIFFTTVKMLLMSFTSQILSLLNFMSILVWFFAVNATIPAQILSKTSPRFSKHWNLNKISVASTRNHLNKILLKLILFSFSLASFKLTSSNLTSFSPTLSSHLSNSQILNHASSH